MKTIFSTLDYTILTPVVTISDCQILVSRVLALRDLVPTLPSLAAICIPAGLVQGVSSKLLGTTIQTATVVNFPLGQSTLITTLQEVEEAIHHGAQEIDLVFPLSQFLCGEKEASIIDYVFQVKKRCRQRYLKTIIQSDELEARFPLPEAIQKIARVSHLALCGGSDMIKTSTGKGSGGASLIAATTMQFVAMHFQQHSPYTKIIGHSPGIKYSGGISNAEQSLAYLALHRKYLGENAASPSRLRFGASSLSSSLLEKLVESDPILNERFHSQQIPYTYLSNLTRETY
ncbi:MAG: hypothetical protein KDD60_10580 [Bdellovibrionales bacterium]|nr:hypothetical protein [Bdellovibrionales bacterium]